MRTNRTAVIVTCVAAAFAMNPWAATAQTAPAAPAAAVDHSEHDMRAKLAAMDTDKNGEWSKAEWLAGGRRERGFEMMDADKNGSLMAAELKSGMERMQAMRGQQQ